MDQPQGGSKGHTLRPLLGGDTYTVELHDAMLQLHAGDGHTVLILPREEAARYLHFEWDLRRGRVVVFRLLGGLRAMRFLCPIAAANAVTAWLPLGNRWSPPTHVLLVVAAGLVGLCWGPSRPIGLGVFLVGLVGLYPARLNLALLQALAAGAGALLALFGPAFGLFNGLAAGMLLYGALLAVTAIEQLAHLGPNHFVYESRRAVAHLGLRRHRSRLVRGVAYAAGAAALAFAGLGLVLEYAPLAPPAPGQPFLDAPVFFLAALGLGAPVPLLWMRRRIPYGEALLTAQLLIAVVTIYAWGIGLHVVATGFSNYTGDAIAASISGPAGPWFAAPLLLLEWAFRRWFIRQAEREAAEED